MNRHASRDLKSQISNIRSCRRAPSLSLSVALVLSVLGSLPAAAAQVITLDGTRLGATFEGIGALSAGASSRLLIDYPAAQRTQILDLLFRPRFGASLQHLKVEIGGDVNSTCGVEPAFAHTREESIDPSAAQLARGYETWLMREARQRNPSLFLDALQWGAPYWIGEGHFFSQDNADYIASFHLGLRRHFGLKIEYQGIWNETDYDPAWIKVLRSTLDRHGLTDVRVIAADQTGETVWKIADDMAEDPALAAAVHAIGDHYLAYRSSPAARASGKPLWANEDGPWGGDWYAATKLAKLYNRSYIEGRLQKFITWSLVTSYYDVLPLPGSGLLRANQPWSGHYEVQPALWVVAQTTQFTEPGWRYVDGGCGYLDEFGSYVTLQSPDRRDHTIVIETMDTPYTAKFFSRQDVEFRFSPEFSDRPLHLWRSGPDAQFVHETTLRPTDGSVRLALAGDRVYTLSTTTGQSKGDATWSVPPDQRWSLPYRDTFERITESGLPFGFIDQAGVFELRDLPSGRGRGLAQVVPRKGIEWRFHRNPEPFTLLGDARWADYGVGVDAQWPHDGYVSVLGRITKVMQDEQPPLGYAFQIGQEGQWRLVAHRRTLARGRIRPPDEGWHRLALTFEGTRVRAAFDGRTVTTVTDDTFARGLAGLGCGWHAAWFDHFAVEPGPSQAHESK